MVEYASVNMKIREAEERELSNAKEEEKIAIEEPEDVDEFSSWLMGIY